VEEVASVDRQGHESESQQAEKGRKPDGRLAETFFQNLAQPSHSWISWRRAELNVRGHLSAREEDLMSTNPKKIEMRVMFASRTMGKEQFVFRSVAPAS
jgi:hypothetical protein